MDSNKDSFAIQDEIESNSVQRSTPGNTTQPIFIVNSSESNYFRTISRNIPIPAGPQMKTLSFLDSQIYLISHFIFTAYSKRPITRPLMKYFEDLKKTAGSDQVSNILKSDNTNTIAKSMLSPIISFFQQIQINAQQLSYFFVNELKKDDFWNDAMYSDLYLSKISKLIYKMISIETVIQYKPGLIDDLSELSKYIKDTNFIMQFQSLRMWICSFNSNTKTIIEAVLKVIPYTRILQFYNIVFPFIQNQIINKKYIYSEDKYSYIGMLIFIVKLYYAAMEKEQKELANTPKAKPILTPISLNERIFIADICQLHKSIMIICEVGPELKQYFPKEIFNFTQKEQQMRKDKSLFGIESENDDKYNNLGDLLDEARMSLFRASRNITKILSHQFTNDESDNLLLSGIPELCREVSSTVSILSEALEQKRLILPPKPDNISDEDWKDNTFKARYQYDYAMTKGISDITKRFLMLIAACRTSIEVLQKNDISIVEQITNLTQRYVQKFVSEQIPLIIQQTPDLAPILNILRDLLGSFKVETIKSDNPKLDGKVVETNIIPKSSVHIMFLELARVQLQMIINPDSPYTRKSSLFSSSLLNEKSIQMIKKFIDDTYFFTDLIRFPELISKAGDLSQLYFKEHWLDRCKVSFFRVKTSLPYILTNYALENYSQIKVIFALFYPLSIYDDAAHFALTSLKSTTLYNEIKNEAQVCLTSITRLIADLTFNPMVTFFATRSFHKSLLNELINEGFFTSLNETSAAPRMNVLLEPNQLFLLGCSVDFKTLIAKRLNELFEGILDQMESIIHQHGLLVMIAIKKIIEVLTIANKQFLSYGIPMHTFNELFRHKFAMDNPDSLQNIIIYNVSDYVTNVLFTDYYTLTTPFRIIPYVQPNISFMSIFKNQGASIMERILRPTCTTITLHHVRAYLEIVGINGASLLFMHFLSLLDSYFEDFIESYTKMHKHFILISSSSQNISVRQAFSRYFGAYSGYLQSSLIDEIFFNLSSIGNIFALTSLLDTAVVLYSTESQFISSYCFSIPITKEDKDFSINSSELFELFDNEFRDSKQYYSSYTKIYGQNEDANNFLSKLVEHFIQLVNSASILQETSQNLLDISSLTSFAASWSILDFLFTLNESMKMCDGNANNITLKWGESTYLVSACIHIITRQIYLHDLISINEKLIYCEEVEFANSKDQKIEHFLKIAKFRRSSFKFATELFLPIVKKLIGED